MKIEGRHFLARLRISRPNRVRGPDDALSDAAAMRRSPRWRQRADRYLRRRLRRSVESTETSSTTTNVPHLDGWRGLAILLVLCCHFIGPGFGWAGGLGVSLFFVLSGLFMGRLLFIRQVRLSDFFARRFARVIPTFWLFVLAMYVYPNQWFGRRYSVPLSELLSTMFFLRSYFPENASIWADRWAIGHTWSLSVEEHSYVVLALVALAARAIGRTAVTTASLIALCAVALVFNFFYLAHAPLGATPWYLRSECASLGLITAAMLVVCRAQLGDWSRRIPSMLPVLTFCIALACFTTYSHKAVDRFIAPPMLAFTVVLLDRSPQVLRHFLSARWLRWLGTCSFSIYLWQQPIYLAFQEGRIGIVGAWTLALGLGAASFYAVENPLRLYLNDRWATRKGASAGEAMPAPGRSA